jgi:hypothetical protein
MQIKRVCTKIQAVYICMYQCSITYRYIQIQPALSACTSESMHANKTCMQIKRVSNVLRYALMFNSSHSRRAIHAGPSLQEIEDAVGNALLDVLVAVPGAVRGDLRGKTQKS